jgi:hypothetical protein
MFARAYMGRKRGATRISYHGAPSTIACAAFIKESRMKLANAIKLDRKSGHSPPLHLRGGKQQIIDKPGGANPGRYCH